MSANRVEKLVYWYLRFNGYLTVENFTIHPNFKRDPEAEADILAVRFPNSQEDPIRFHFERDCEIVIPNHVDFIIGEVKSSRCAINDSWEDPDRENIQYALRWMGFLPEDEISSVSLSVYNQKNWVSKLHSVRFVCFGNVVNQELRNKYPDMKQILHRETIEFVYRRLTTGCLKLHRENWDIYIQYLSSRVNEGWNPGQLLAWTLANE